MHNGQQLLLMHGMDEFCTLELHGVKHDWLSTLESLPIGQNCTSGEVTHVRQNEDTIRAHVCVINDGEALTADNNMLDCLEGSLVGIIPGEILLRIPHSKGC